MNVLATVSDHAKKRIRERVGVPSGSAERRASIAWEKGLQHGELKGNLRKYVDGKVIDTKATPRVHGEFLFLFNRDGKLHTVWLLPPNLRKLAIDLVKKKRE